MHKARLVTDSETHRATVTTYDPATECHCDFACEPFKKHIQIDSPKFPFLMPFGKGVPIPRGSQLAAWIEWNSLNHSIPKGMVTSSATQ